MANDNNNINELVADDDPTVELELRALIEHHDGAAEADLKTFDAENAADEDSNSGVTVTELKSDLRSRKKTISHLQYDIEQLRAKWLGLETEISARESQTAQLNIELSSSRDTVARKDKLLKKRDRTIKTLKSEIRQRDSDYRQLKQRLDTLQLSMTEAVPLAGDPERSIGELQQRLHRMEHYADSIRQQSQDLAEFKSHAEREIESLSHRLQDKIQENSELTHNLVLAAATLDELRSTLSEIQDRHDEEIRLLRFELGAAEETAVETEELNSQLASDLIDACGFKDELERMLADVEEKSSGSIAELQKEINKLQRAAENYEQKLATKSDAISLLLAELAKKSEQIESIGEIEDVIQDIDERMNNKRSPAEKITRLLVGTVDRQLLRFPLFKDRLTIGRTKDNDIQLEAGYVSRRHAVIQTDGETTRIIDWGSKNGIYVNSERVSEHFLEHGDSIVIGNARFRYEERKKRGS